MAGQKQVLIIDDDPDFLDYVRIVLSANDYEVVTATTAVQGLERMRQTPPDLVIVDVMMSYALDGWAVSREMEADPRLRYIPIMIVSAIVSDKEDAIFPEDVTDRVSAFMSKPLDPSALLQCVAELTQVA